MKNIKFIIIGLLIIFSAGIYGCSNKTAAGDSKAAANSQYPLKVVDAFNREVALDKEPARVVSVAPELTEIVFALGKGDKLVGRTDYCDYPAEASKVASVGQITEPNVEKIVELKPDVVIASDLTKKETVEKLAQLNIKVVIISGIKSFDGVYDNIKKAGSILNAKAEADKLVADMKTKVENVKEKVKSASKPTVYYVVSYGPSGDWTAGKNSFTSSIIEMAGGTNAAADVQEEYSAYSIEKLVEKNPDILICSKFFDTKKGIEDAPGYKDLKAVKEGKLLEIDNNLLDRQVPRIADGLEAVAKLIHPELFK